jgi:hypothetical protein
MATFLRTRGQVLGHRLYLGTLAGAATAVALGVPLLVRRVGGYHDPPGLTAAWLVAVLAPVLFGLVGGVFGGRGTGVNADDGGVRRVPAVPGGFWRWPEIVDIREQRRGGRNVVAIDLDSGLELRLPTPYHGRLLGRDAEFEHKYFTLRNLWELHRRAGSRL